MKLNKASEEFKDWVCFLKEEERSINTINTYTQGIKKFFSKYKELDKLNLIEWKDELKLKYKSRTVNLYITAMNEYLKFLNKDKLKLKLVRVKTSMHTENVISFDDYKKLLECLIRDNDKRRYYMVKILAETGVRVSELLKLKIEDLENGIVNMHTKANKCRPIYLKKTLMNELKEWTNNEGRTAGYIILNRFGEPMTSRGVLQTLYDLADKYEIKKETMHPHSFRHFFAIQFLKKENNIALLADLMGHSSIATTALYTRLSQAEQMAKLNEIVDW